MNKRWLRVGLLIAFLVAVYAIARATGLDQMITREWIRDTMQNAGFIGFLIYIVVFTVGLLVQIPGFVFVAGAALAYGWFWSALASIVASSIGVIVSFIIVRKIGGQPLSEIKQPFVRKILDQLDTRPIRTIVITRFFLWSVPPLNYSLAMSNVTFKNYCVGSVLGLLAPMTYLSIFFDWALNGGAERLVSRLSSFFG